MPKVTALKPFSYAGARYAKGDSVIVKDKHARALIAAGIARASDGPDIHPPAPQVYATRHLEAKPMPKDQPPLRGYATANLHSFTVPELKQQARRRGIAYPTRVTKGALIKLLKG